jgi:hypothetical protein
MTPLSPKSADVKLEPCPFCGGQADGPYLTGVADGAGEFYSIECVERDCSAVITERGHDAAVAAWNRRAALSPPAHEDERVREIADRLNARYRNCKKGGGGHNEEETRAICREAELFLRALPSVSSAEAGHAEDDEHTWRKAYDQAMEMHALAEKECAEEYQRSRELRESNSRMGGLLCRLSNQLNAATARAEQPSSAEAMRRACAEVARKRAEALLDARDGFTSGSKTSRALERAATEVRSVADAIEALPAPTGDWVLVPRELK